MPIPLVNLVTADGRTVQFCSTVRSGIPYIESLECDEGWARDANTQTRFLTCKWSDRVAFVQDLLGTSRYVAGAAMAGQVSNILRLLPEAHPELSFFFASDCKLVEPIAVPQADQADLAKALTSGADFGSHLEAGVPVSNTDTFDPTSFMVSFSLAKYAVTYTTHDYWILANDPLAADEPAGELAQASGQPQAPGPYGELVRYISRRFAPAAENQRIPATSFQYLPSGKILENIAITQYTIELHYTWHEVPIVPWATIRATVGKCNVALFDPLYGQFPAQTLICLAPQLHGYFNSSGDYVWDVEYIFIFRPPTWNAVFKIEVNAGGEAPGSTAGLPGYNLTSAIGNVQALITPTADFDALFRL